MGKQVIGAAVTTATLSVGFMIFNDYIAPPPNLAGRWKFTVVYEDTARSSFQDMKVTYQALLIQEGLELSGTGEKLSEKTPGSDLVKYDGDKRTSIQIVGNVTRAYFSRDTLVIHYNEAGDRRDSATLHQLEYFDAQTMCGCFQSTIANTYGSVWWERLGERDDFYRPAELPNVCSHVDCPVSSAGSQ